MHHRRPNKLPPHLQRRRSEHPGADGWRVILIVWAAIFAMVFVAWLLWPKPARAASDPISALIAAAFDRHDAKPLVMREARLRKKRRARPAPAPLPATTPPVMEDEPSPKYELATVTVDPVKRAPLDEEWVFARRELLDAERPDVLTKRAERPRPVRDMAWKIIGAISIAIAGLSLFAFTMVCVSRFERWRNYWPGMGVM